VRVSNVFFLPSKQKNTDIIGILGIDILEQIVVVGLSLVLPKTRHHKQAGSAHR
jgi:hypothetical protein